jgi:hypothetical protein
MFGSMWGPNKLSPQTLTQMLMENHGGLCGGIMCGFSSANTMMTVSMQ